MKDEIAANRLGLEFGNQPLNAIDNGSVLPGVCFGPRPSDASGDEVRPVGVPTAIGPRRDFLRKWARRNARRIAAGLGPIVLVLPLAGAAAAQDQMVRIDEIEGIAGYEVLPDGDLLVTLASGETYRIAAANLQVGPDGAVLVSSGMANMIAAAADAAGSPDFGGDGLIGAGAAIAGLGLAAAAGGDGGGGGTATPVETAFAIDGYLSGARVFGDANGNGTFDSGEVQTTTAADGSFNAALFAEGVPLVATGGIDISTGEAFTGTLKAPAGSTVITPLTTLVQTVIETNGGEVPLSPAEAAAQVSAALGLGGDLLNDDPVALAEGGDLGQLEAAAKIAALINLVSAASPADPEGALDAVLGALAENLTDGAGEDPLTDPAQIEAALAAAGDLIDVDAGALSQAIADAAGKVEDAVQSGGLAELEAVQSVIQGSLTQAVEDSVGATGTTPLDTANTSDIYTGAVALRPVITVSEGPDGPINSAEGISLSGSGRAGTTITAEFGLITKTTTVDANGDWAIAFDNSAGIKAFGTPDEEIGVVVTARTASGVTSGPALDAPVYLVDTLQPDRFNFLEITGQEAQYINAEQLAEARLTGTADPGSVITYQLNGGAEQTHVVGQDGFVSIDISTDYIEGLNTFGFVLRDAAGNVAPNNGNISYFVDTVAPDAPLSDYQDAVAAPPTPNAAYRGSGTGTPGDRIETLLLQEGEEPVSLGTTTVQSDGTWGFSSLLTGIPEGVYQIQAVALDQAGNRTEGTPETLVIDFGAPEAPSITSGTSIGTATGNAVENGEYSIFGTAEPGAFIDVTIGGEPQARVTADETGNWSIMVPAVDGIFAVSATATDLAGNVSPATQTTIEVDTAPATIVSIDAPDSANAATAGDFTVTGTISEAAQVTVTIYRVDGPNRIVRSEQTVSADQNGDWTASFDLGGESDGDYLVGVRSFDGFNAPDIAPDTPFTLDLTPPALAVTSPAGDVTFGAAEVTAGIYTISGTAEAGAEVTVSVNGTDTTVTATDGTWTVERTAIEGTDSISVVAVDAAGNASAPVLRTVTYDATDPEGVAIDGFDAVVNAAAAQVSFTGTAEEGTDVAVEIRPSAGAPIALTLDSFTGGVWSASGAVPADGSYTVAVTVTDAAGNVTEVVSGTSFLVDATPPAAPTGLALAGDSLADGVINIEEDGGAAVTGTASAGAELAWSTSLGASGTVTADGTTGAFTIPLDGLLGEGDTTVAVRELDAAGNLSEAATLVVAADLTAPAAPTIDAVAGDNLVDATEAAGGTLTYSGSGEPGTTVTLSLGGTPVDTVTVDGTGVWEITAAVPADGTYTASVAATDAAGNATPGGSAIFTVNTSAAAIAIDPLAVGAVANASEVGAVTVTGTFGNATTVSVRVLDGGTQVIAPLAAQLDTGAGTWSLDLDLSGLGDGDVTIEATADNGVSPATTTTTLAIDATPPAAPTFDTVSGDDLLGTADLDAGSYTLTGTTEAGSSVALTFNGTETVAATVDGTTWSYVRTASEGTDSVEATATDAAGNTSQAASTSIEIDLTPPDAPGVDTYATTLNGADASLDITGTGTDGDTVTVTLAGPTTEVLETTVSGGTWGVSFARPADGSYAVSVTVTDAAGNETAGAPLPGLTVDAAAPAAPVIDPVAGDGTVNAAEASSGNYTVTGSAEAGATVTFDDGAGGVFTTTADGAGDFSIDLAAADGTDDWTVTATDAAGNTSAGTPLSVTIDTTPPAAPGFDLASDTYDETEVDAVTISGTAEAGSTVTLSSALFDSGIIVVEADNAGLWTTGSLDLSGKADASYTITAVATDAAGNLSSEATATRVVDAAPPVSIALTSGETEGEFVLYSAAEFAIFDEAGESETVEGTVLGVPEGTTVAVEITGFDGSGAPFTLTYDTVTDALGAFSLTIPEADIIAQDGMTDPGTATISAGGETLTLEVLINSAIEDGTQTTFLSGRFAVSPVAEAEDALGLGGMDLDQAGTLPDGTLVAVLNSNTDPGYKVIATYDGSGSTAAEFFAFDGGAGGDLAALSSQVFLRGDEVVIAQASITGTVNPTNVTQGDSPLYTVYRIPAASLAEALPAQGSQDNFVTDAAGVTSFGIDLADIDASYGGGGIPANIIYLFTDLSNATGDPVVLVSREDADTGALSQAFLVEVDLDTGSVESRPLEASALWVEGTQELDTTTVFAALETDDAGNYVSALFEAPGSGDGITRGVLYDYATGSFTAAAQGTDGARDLMVAVGGPEILDGGDGAGGADDDIIVVGNTPGTAGALQVTVSGGVVTVSVATEALLGFLSEVPPEETSVTIPFDLFVLGSAALTDPAGSTSFGTYTAASIFGPDTGTTADGIDVARITIDIDLGTLRTVDTQAVPTVELFSTAASGTDGSAFYGFGVNTSDDPSLATAPPAFDGLIHVGGVDGSGSQIVILEDSAGRGGFDIVTGLDVSSGSDEDVLRIEADFGGYRGTGLEVVPEGGTLGLASDTGIVVFQGTNTIEDNSQEFADLMNGANLGLVGERAIVVIADASGTGLFSVDFDASGAFDTADSFARIDGLTDLSSFGADNIELLLPTLPTV